jgi:hypothetical protein
VNSYFIKRNVLIVSNIRSLSDEYRTIFLSVSSLDSIGKDKYLKYENMKKRGQKYGIIVSIFNNSDDVYLNRSQHSSYRNSFPNQLKTLINDIDNNGNI